nr:hypothetical protein [Halomonas elongata]
MGTVQQMVELAPTEAIAIQGDLLEMAQRMKVMARGETQVRCHDAAPSGSDTIVAGHDALVSHAHVKVAHALPDRA